MDGWIDEDWMSGWMDGDRWMDGSVVAWMFG